MIVHESSLMDSLSSWDGVEKARHFKGHLFCRYTCYHRRHILMSGVKGAWACHFTCLKHCLYPLCWLETRVAGTDGTTPANSCK